MSTRTLHLLSFPTLTDLRCADPADLLVLCERYQLDPGHNEPGDHTGAREALTDEWERRFTVGPVPEWVESALDARADDGHGLDTFHGTTEDPRATLAWLRDASEDPTATDRFQTWCRVAEERLALAMYDAR